MHIMHNNTQHIYTSCNLHLVVCLYVLQCLDGGGGKVGYIIHVRLLNTAGESVGGLDVRVGR